MGGLGEETFQLPTSTYKEKIYVMIFSATLHYSILCTGPKLLCMEMRSLKMMSMVAKTRALTLLDQGVLQKDIAKEVNVDVQIIYRLKKRAEDLSK